MPIQVENYRTSTDDADTINAAFRDIEAMPSKGRELEFERGRTYTLGHSPKLETIGFLEIGLNGATLKRANAALTRATAYTAFTSTTTTIPITPPANWRVGDEVYAYVDDTNAGASNRVIITALNATSFQVNAGFGATLGGLTNYPIGTIVAKIVYLLVGRPSYGTGAMINPHINIMDGTIDGNGATVSNYSWRNQCEIGLHTRHGSFRRVDFKNTAGENIVGHGISIEDCHATNLGGSLLHTSMHSSLRDQSSPSAIRRSTVRGSNKNGQVKIGHSEGLVTFSWSGGDLTVEDCNLENGREPTFGAATSDIARLTIRRNTCSGFALNPAPGGGGIFAGLNPACVSVSIEDNAFHDCSWNGYLAATASNPSIVVRNNRCSGNTSGVN